MNEQPQPTGQPIGAERVRSHPARAALVQALARVERGERDGLEELHKASCAFVAALRKEGATKEQILDEVRQVAASPVTPEGASKIPPIAREALAELTLRWCTDEYGRIGD
jgi:hypothetical protein